MAMLVTSFVIILFILMVLFVVGMFKPSTLLFKLSKEKQTRKYVLIVLSPLIILFIIINGYLANSMEKEANKDSDETSEQEYNDEITEEEEYVETPELILSTMKEEFEFLGDIDFDNSISSFLITPTDEDAIESFELLNGLDPDKRSNDVNDNWNTIVDKFKAISNTIGSKYDILLMNPSNEGKALLKINDGDVEYDAFNDDDEI